MCNHLPVTLALLAIILLPGCGKKETPAAPTRSIPVATAQAHVKEVEVTQSAVGSIASPAMPLLAAEVLGQVVSVRVDNGEPVVQGQLLAEIDPQPFALALRGATAEVGRLQALIDNQALIVKRFTKLSSDDFVSATSLEQAQTQLAALTQERIGAEARVATVARDLEKAKILSPINGSIQERYVAVGDYVNKGSPLFRIINQDRVQVRLPFPETVAHLLKIGQTVRLSTPTDPGQVVESRITELRPMVGTDNRAMETVTEIPRPPDWLSGASVDGDVVIDSHQSVMVPDVSVILRPKGTVVYLAVGAKAVERVVKKGRRVGGEVEILSGLAAGETVVTDGAYYLSDGAAITVAKDKP